MFHATIPPSLEQCLTVMAAKYELGVFLVLVSEVVLCCFIFIFPYFTETKTPSLALSLMLSCTQHSTSFSRSKQIKLFLFPL